MNTKTKEHFKSVKALIEKTFIYFRNTRVPCTHIPRLDLSKWRDPSCYPHGEHRQYGQKETDSYKGKGNVENVDQKHPKNMITNYGSLFNTLFSYSFE